MAEIRAVTALEAANLMGEGYVYLDVRSEPEFEDGHPPSALNVPLMHFGASGMVANPEFMSVMESAFGKTEKLIVGCRTGGRSRRAAEMLVQTGFTEIVDLSCGFDGSRDAFGRPLLGWSRCSLPVEKGAPDGQKYPDVKRRQRRA